MRFCVRAFALCSAQPPSSSSSSRRNKMQHNPELSRALKASAASSLCTEWPLFQYVLKGHSQDSISLCLSKLCPLPSFPKPLELPTCRHLSRINENSCWAPRCGTWETSESETAPALAAPSGQRAAGGADGARCLQRAGEPAHLGGAVGVPILA